MTLVKFNPVRDLINVEREFNKMFNSLSNRFGISGKMDNEEYDNTVWMPLTDIYEDKDNYVIKTDLPGMKKSEVKISFSNGELLITGERLQEEESKDTKWHRVERTFGRYFRSFTLPKEIKQDKINAEFKEGQLTITIPKADEVKPKEIEISLN